PTASTDCAGRKAGRHRCRGAILGTKRASGLSKAPTAVLVSARTLTDAYVTRIRPEQVSHQNQAARRHRVCAPAPGQTGRDPLAEVLLGRAGGRAAVPQ